MSSLFVLSDEDRSAIERQLGRPVRGDVRVAVRCPCGLPAVIETHPLVDGTPFPTLYWLTCRRTSAVVGSLESSGAIAAVNERIANDDDFRAALEEATADYIARRDVYQRLEGGVGGGRADHVKCLHAHLAHHLVCACNPVGAWVLEQIGNVMRPPPCA